MNIKKTSSLENNEYFDTKRLNQGLRKRSVRGAGTSVFSNILSTIVQMVSTIILARILAPSDFGLVAMVTSVSMFFMLFRNFGLTEAIIQKEDINHNQVSTLFWINAAFSLGLTLLFIALAPFLAWSYEEPRVKAIAVVIAFSFFLGGVSTQHLAIMKRNFQFYKIAAINIFSMVLSIIIVIVLAWLGFGYWALVVRRVLFALLTTFSALIVCRWRPSLPSRGTGVKPLLKFGINTLGNVSLTYLSRNLDKILIGMRFGSESLGFYDKAYRLFVAPAQQLSMPLLSVSVATLSRLRNEPENFRRYYLKALSFLAFVGMPISASLTLAGNDIILMLLGPQWYEVGQIFTVFGCAIGVIMLYSTHSWLHMSLDCTDRWLRWGMFSAVLTISSFFVGLNFGTIGVAIAFTSSLYILIIPCLWYAGKPIELTLLSLLSAIWRYFFAALAAGVFSWHILYSYNQTSGVFIQLNIFVRILVSFALCGFMYLVLVVVLYQSFQPIMKHFAIFQEALSGLKLKISK